MRKKSESTFSDGELSALKDKYTAAYDTEKGKQNVSVGMGLLNTLLGVGIPAAAVGAGIHYMSRKKPSLSKATLTSDEEKEKRQKKLDTITSMIDSTIKKGSLSVKKANVFGDTLRGLADNTLEGGGSALRGVTDYVGESYKRHSKINDHTDSSLYYPTIAAGLLGGSYLGYKGFQGYMDDKIKEEQLQYIEKRKKALDVLLYDKMNTPEIDTTYEKRSSAEPERTSRMNKGLGIYLVLAGLLGTGGYIWGKGEKNKRKEERDAFKDYMSYAQTNKPMPISIDTAVTDEEPDEEDASEIRDVPIIVREPPQSSGSVDNQQPSYAFDNYQSKEQDLLKYSKLLLK